MSKFVDYENALWGKDIYTIKGLMVRAEILKEYIPEIEGLTDDYIKSLEEVEVIPVEDILHYNQREFSRWLNKAFFVLNKLVKLANCYLSNEMKDLPMKKVKDFEEAKSINPESNVLERDFIRTALLGCYKNREETTMYDVIDNILFVSNDFCYGFNPEESCVGVITDYLLSSDKKYKNADRKKTFDDLSIVYAEFIVNYKDNEDVYFELLNKFKYEKSGV